ncbi:lytic transglycosylase domain-containing protein [Alicyclobacillus mengziensis]|uniref:Lytic transglycosylase domain-containing protein n=1 Tax=Alicyclobacillus mengziensis TaxID=2931921 RepID=A0A9X7VX59_9BACL|nr:lytic transglycosylase domain-containing protein [Alicyclobacillus mengziensis]QSO46122.1 lytic transglycosylase domain-containing protein [Alicyclobacillus mengziensis]
MNLSPASPNGTNIGQTNVPPQTSGSGQTSLFSTSTVGPSGVDMNGIGSGSSASTTLASWAAILAEMLDMTAMGQSLSASVGQTSATSVGSSVAASFGQSLASPTVTGTSSPMNLADFWLQQVLGQLGGAAAGNIFSNKSVSSSVANDLFPGMNAMAGSSTNIPSQTVADAVNQASTAFGLPAQLINSVIQTESAYQPNAVSSAGAIGLMQLMPATAREMGVQNPYDPIQNIWGGTRYLSSLVNQFHGDVKLAVAAYNAGPEAVVTHGGVPPYPETQQYVQKVLQGAGMDI